MLLWLFMMIVLSGSYAACEAPPKASAAVTSSALMADEETLEAITELKNAIVAAHKERDREALDRLYAEDYTAIDANGEIRTKSDLLNGLATDPKMVEGRYAIVAVRRWGNIAVATGHGHLIYRNPDGSTRVADYYSTNVFEIRQNRWRYVAAFLP